MPKRKPAQGRNKVCYTVEQEKGKEKKEKKRKEKTTG